MKIAVTYENGTIFQHFGKTEAFKIYETEEGRILSSEVIRSNGTGHGALAGFLAGQGIDVVICGGIGGGAQNALAEAGIELCAGAQGDADQAVEAYLKGELISAGVTCHHHHEGGHDCGRDEENHSCGGNSCGSHEEKHSCGNHEEESGCGGSSCGSGCGGNCGSQSNLTGRNVGKTCRTHYRGTFNDGTQFDSSYDRGEPLEFICGAGMMIQGFDAAVADMEVGQIVDVHLMPEEAYGLPDPNAIFTVETRELPGSEDLEVGAQVYLANQYGQPFPVKVTAKEGSTITFDANHEMAGKELNFRIELVEVLG
jgi:FKBP-type peptidyl-prolyl cis-trans isomerase 2/predicted Fe-Mo cluster-binding NifX family protein